MFTTLILAAVLASSSSTRADETVLRTAAEVAALCELPYAPKTPFEVRGIVAYVNTYGGVIVEDSSGRAFVFNGKGDDCRVGDMVVLNGLAGVPNPHGHIPWMWNVSVRVVGRGTAPVPRDIRLADIKSDLPDLATVRLEGEVLEVFSDEIDAQTEFFILRDGNSSVLVTFNSTDAPARQSLKELALAHIRMTGTYFRHNSGKRLFSGPSISLSSTNDIAIVTPPPADPFDAPPLEAIIRETPDEIAALGHRSVAGTVAAVWRGNRVLVRADAYDGMSASGLVRLELARDVGLPRPGTRVRAVGRPATDTYRLNLVNARWRPEPGPPSAAPKPHTANLSQLLRDKNGRPVIETLWHGRAVRIRGTVRRVSGADDAKSFHLLSDGHLVTVCADACPDTLHGLDADTVVEATGVWLVDAENARDDLILPRIEGVALALRTADDLKILARPPWWTTTRLLTVVGALTTLLVGLVFWNRSINRVAERRGRQLLRERIANADATLRIDERTRLAVELHDSLSQTLTGVSYQVNAASRALEADPAQTAARLNVARRTLQSCRNELRNCLWDLRNEALEEKDAAEAIRKTLTPHTADATLTVLFDANRTRISDTTFHAILRMIRELVVNAVRHGEARHIAVRGTLDAQQLVFSVTDDGKGFDPENRPGQQEGHFGLQGIQERLNRLDGHMDITSAPGQGTCVTITIRSCRKQES